ncbi:hypothetical protein ACJJIW_16715 [Microbulbifer sp. JMSA004]|uniref:hypothetical protein n=1 Tax=Microbulbifer sp. JMSA004 TaxID=3243370 RepID=UPI00403A1504
MIVMSGNIFKKNGFWDFCRLGFSTSFIAGILISYAPASELRDDVLIFWGAALVVFTFLFTVFGVFWSLCNREKLGLLTTSVYILVSIFCAALFGYYLYMCERKGALPLGG